MSGGTDRLDEMLERAKPMSRAEQLKAYQAMNAKHGMVAGFRTTQEKFEAYMRKRREEDEAAKHGVGCRRLR